MVSCVKLPTMRLDFRFLSLLALTSVTSPLALAKRGVTPEDYLTFESIGDARIAPNGKQVAYVLTTIDAPRNRRKTSIWMVAADGASAPRRLTSAAFNSSSPRWSPGGERLAFLSSRDSETREQGGTAT